MKELLETALPQSYGSKQKISVIEECQEGTFGVTDPKSCNDCKIRSSYFYLSCNDRKVSIHRSSIPVNIIRLEDVFQQFKKVQALKEGGCCDILMYTKDEIVVMDMTCSRPDYINNHEGVDGTIKAGKRAVAYQQIADSIRKLRKCDAIRMQLDSYQSRVAIFAVRRKKFALEESESVVTKAMKSFSKIIELEIGMVTRIEMGNGFSFIVQEYPDVFVW